MNKFDNIKAVVCDLDGTLLNNRSMISDHTREVIRKLRDKGIRFGICTGRPAAGIKNLLKKWQITDDVDFVLCFNGGTLIDLDGNILEQDYDLKADDVAEIMDHFKKYNANFCQYQDGELWTLKKDIPTFGMTARNEMKLVKKEEQELHHDTQKLMITGMPGKISRILKNEAARGENYHLFRSGPFLIEILNSNLNKFKGIEKLERKFGWKPEEIMSFGNDNNDIEMLEGSFGVAMKNALDNVKPKAKMITDKSNNDDGVADFIEQHLL